MCVVTFLLVFCVGIGDVSEVKNAADCSMPRKVSFDLSSKTGHSDSALAPYWKRGSEGCEFRFSLKDLEQNAPKQEASANSHESQDDYAKIKPAMLRIVPLILIGLYAKNDSKSIAVIRESLHNSISKQALFAGAQQLNDLFRSSATPNASNVHSDLGLELLDKSRLPSETETQRYSYLIAKYAFQNDPEVVEELAMDILGSSTSFHHRELEIADNMLNIATAAKGETPELQDCLSLVYFREGRSVKAFEMERRAMGTACSDQNSRRAFIAHLGMRLSVYYRSFNSASLGSTKLFLVGRSAQVGRFSRKGVTSGFRFVCYVTGARLGDALSLLGAHQIHPVIVRHSASMALYVPRKSAGKARMLISMLV